MTHPLRWLVGTFLVTAILAGSATGWCISAEDIAKQIDQTKKKLTQTIVKQKSVTGRLVSSQKQAEKVRSNLDKINDKLGTTQKQIGMVQNQLSLTQNQLQQLQNQIVRRKSVLGKRLSAIYKYGYQSYLEALFQARDYGEFVSRFEMVGRYVRADLSVLKNIQEEQNEVAKKQEEIAKQHQELEQQKNAYSQLQVTAKTEHSRWLSRVQDQQRELSMIQNDRRSLEKALDELEDLSRSMESQIRGMQNKNKTALGTGQYVWPTRGRITSYFGYRIHPILRTRRYHSGIDIAAPYGQPIVAADSGVVIFAATNGGYGKMIAIDHGNSISTVYAHCSTLLVTVGQNVTKGQLIAKIGSTGLSTGPHCHFEVRKNGVPVDPTSYL
jgi:murein DD-endopeptidase MepM/ murein hydrolase activator NlpD